MGVVRWKGCHGRRVMAEYGREGSGSRRGEVVRRFFAGLLSAVRAKSTARWAVVEVGRAIQGDRRRSLKTCVTRAPFLCRARLRGVMNDAARLRFACCP